MNIGINKCFDVSTIKYVKFSMQDLCLSFCILLALCRHLTSPVSLMLCKWVPVMFWAVLIPLL